MKKHLYIFVICLCFSVGSIQGQENPYQNPTEQTSEELPTKEPSLTSPSDNWDQIYRPSEEEVVKETDTFQSKFMNMMFMLGLLIAFMLLASWMLKRMTKQRQEQMNISSSIKLLETRVLSPRTTIYLLDIQGQGMVIAESPTTVQHIATIPLEDVGD